MRRGLINLGLRLQSSIRSMPSGSPPFGASEVPDGADPIEITADWVAAEREEFGHEIAAAISLATVDAEGMPNNRFVLLKQVDRAVNAPDPRKRGYVFYTNNTSKKAEELRSTKVAAITHWNQPLGRAFRVRGHVQPASEAEADEYFNSRPRQSQLGAWASDQSSPLETLDALKESLREVEQRFEGQDVPRPPHWGGWRIVPTYVELWWNRDSRLHERVSFSRGSAEERWQQQMLNP